MTGSRADSFGKVKKTLWFWFLSFEQNINCFLFFGFPDETFSSRLGRAHLTGRPKWFAVIGRQAVDAVFYLLFKEVEHCVNAVEHEDKFETRPEIWSWSVR